MISLIMTVLNEKNTLPNWFDSFLSQTIMPDEIIIVDGGSSDGTWEYLQEKKISLPILKIIRSSGNIAHGRNVAIAAAKGDVIVATDAGCVYDRDWLKKLTASAKEKQWGATAFSSWFRKDDSWLVYAVAASTIPIADEFKRDWLPSSRSVAFKRELWESVKGYPEWIPFCEDVIFDRKIEKQFGKPNFVREPLVFWRPRLTIKSYLRQLFNYTKSEGHGKLNIDRQLIRYVAYFFGAALLFLAIKFSSVYLVLFLIGVAIYMTKFWRRWWNFTNEKNLIYRIGGLFAVPFMVVIGDAAKMTGFPVGIIELISGKIKFQKI